MDLQNRPYIKTEDIIWIGPKKTCKNNGSSGLEEQMTIGCLEDIRTRRLENTRTRGSKRPDVKG
jgi:hypothetical protein